MRVVGVSPFHDSSVAIYNDGDIEFFAKEERITRKKRDSRPWKALQLAKNNAKGPIDFAVFASPSILR